MGPWALLDYILGTSAYLINWNLGQNLTNNTS